jgi:carbon storage regulator
MLVLRRKQGEAIVLNQVIVIRVLGIEGDRVKLGIDAPPDVIVVRDELLDDSARQVQPKRVYQEYGVTPEGQYEEVISSHTNY